MQAGIELAKRAVELKPRLKVVYSTGLSVTDGMKALFVPGSAVLEKPYTVDQLLTSLSARLTASAAFVRVLIIARSFFASAANRWRMDRSTPGQCARGWRVTYPAARIDADQKPLSAYSLRGTIT